MVNVDGSSSKWLDAAMWDEMELSPDRQYIMVAKVQKPFSYIVPYSRFPVEYEIYDVNGNLVKDLFDIPLLEELPKGFMSVSTHPRRINWRSDRPSTLVWAEALDEGNPENEVEFRDAVYQLEVPFNQPKVLLVKTKERYSGISWCNNELAIVYEYWWNTRNSRISKFNPSSGSGDSELLIERNYQDRYTDPGFFCYRKK